MTSIGVTGTRKGMTASQQLAAAAELRALCRITAVHVLRHGDCVGVDAEMNALARHLGLQTIAHPPADPRLRAYAPSSHVLPVRPYLARNRDIVTSSWAMIACPSGPDRTSGTWSTIRYARKVGRPLVIVHPDGRVARERMPVPD